MHLAHIYTRDSGGYADSGNTWKCRVQPVSATLKLEATRYPEMTHLIIGEGTPTITEGMRLDVYRGSTLLGTFYVNGAQKMERPGVGRFSQEVYATSSED